VELYGPNTWSNALQMEQFVPFGPVLISREILRIPLVRTADAGTSRSSAANRMAEARASAMAASRLLPLGVLGRGLPRSQA
jgi:hypothetical protein